MYLGNLYESKLPKPERRKKQENNCYVGTYHLKGFKRDGVTQYRYVTRFIRGQEEMFKSQLTNSVLKTTHWMNWYTTAREAAIAVDKKLLEFGLEPVNILKRKVS